MFFGLELGLWLFLVVVSYEDFERERRRRCRVVGLFVVLGVFSMFLEGYFRDWRFSLILEGR